jgi:hypothetical protein
VHPYVTEDECHFVVKVDINYRDIKSVALDQARASDKSPTGPITFAHAPQVLTLDHPRENIRPQRPGRDNPAMVVFYRAPCPRYPIMVGVQLWALLLHGA